MSHFNFGIFHQFYQEEVANHIFLRLLSAALAYSKILFTLDRRLLRGERVCTTQRESVRQ